MTQRPHDEPGADERPAWLGNLAHDLRSPLSPVVTGVTLLKTGRLEARQQSDLLDAMLRQLNGLIQLIDDTGELLARRTPTVGTMDVASLLDMAGIRMTRQFEEIGARFVATPPSESIEANGDAKSLVRLVGFFALRTAEIAGRGQPLNVTVRRDGDTVCIDFDVAAPSVDAEPELARIVEKFVADTTPNHITDAMMQSILRRCGARLERSPAHGLCVRLSTPANA